MTVLREELPSLEYWGATRERQAQRFYVALCLFVASVQDAFLGAKERAQHNLNWSATCSYYSLVHAGRLLCFLAFGDYPKQHNLLQRLFGAGNGEFRCDWLQGLGQETGERFRWPWDPRTLALENWKRLLSMYVYLVGVDDHDLHRFGRVLAAAAKLRTDANYEALLIANEQQHAITPTFGNLAEAMYAGAHNVGLPLVAKAFRGYVERDLDLEPERPAYQALVHDYLTTKAAPELERKLDMIPDLAAEVRGFLGGILLRHSSIPFDHLEERFSRGLFTGKAHLMQGFQERVDRLQATVADDTAPPGIRGRDIGG